MKYRVREAATVDAMQWDGTDAGAELIHEWSGKRTYTEHFKVAGMPRVIAIHGSLMTAKPTDFVVLDPAGRLTTTTAELFNGAMIPVTEPLPGFEEKLAEAREQLADIVTDMDEGPDSEDLARRLFRPMLEWLVDQHQRANRPQTVVSAWIHIGAYIALWVNAATRTPEEKTHGLVNMLELMRKEALVLHSMDEAEDFEVTDLLAEKAAAGTTH